MPTNQPLGYFPWKKKILFRVFCCCGRNEPKISRTSQPLITQNYLTWQSHVLLVSDYSGTKIIFIKYINIYILLQSTSPPTSKMMPPVMAMRDLRSLSFPAQVVHFIPIQATPRPAMDTMMPTIISARVAWREPGGRQVQAKEENLFITNITYTTGISVVQSYPRLFCASALN